MKTFRIILTAVAIALSAAVAYASGPQMAVDDKTHNFGNVKEDGGDVSHDFLITNTGDAPLIVKSAVTSCGCTTPEVPKAPIAPGKSAVIKVTYNPLGRPGEFDKTITVKTNGHPSKHRLRIVGVVVPRMK